MGSKSSNFYQSDRPESGGANKDGIKDKTGLHARDKQTLESHRAREREEHLIPESGENPELARVRAARAQGADQDADADRFQGSE
jgi:hypothetical protein